jgi:Leucine-rich repeat (LRR) protein
MLLSPKQIYDNLQKKRFNQLDALNLLISILEEIDDDYTCHECLEIISKVNTKNERLFKILENILISHQNENLRYHASKLLKSKFHEKVLSPFIWAINHENSYNFLFLLLNSLKDIQKDDLNSLLHDEVKKIEMREFRESLNPLILNETYKEHSVQSLVEVLINHITISSLKNKFKNLEFKLSDGKVIDLDFSNVNLKILDWKIRLCLKDCSDLFGVKSLNNLKNIRLLPIDWIIKNDYTLTSGMTLISALEFVNNEVAKEAIINQIFEIKDDKFNHTIAELVKPSQSLDNLSISKLAEILRNYISITYLKKKNIPIDYEVKLGEVINICIEDWSLCSFPEVFKYFNSLQSLKLKNCRISVLPKYISSYKWLKHLDLEGNKLKSLPQAIGNLKSLKELNLKNNKLESIPFSMGLSFSLQDLNLANNLLSELPYSLTHLVSLKILDLSNNRLKEIPQTVGSLKGLETLNLSSNRIEYLPKSIGLLKSLISLNLDRNLISSLPDSLGFLVKLKSLSVEENKLTTLPRSIRHLISLNYLNLGWNKLIRIPESIGVFCNLRKLSLIDNQIIHFPKSISKLKSLEELDASGNRLTEIPGDINNLKSLKLLLLANNNIDHIPHNLCLLNNISYIDLSENEIETLPDSISLLENLQVLNLNANNLNFLPESIGDLESLKMLYLNSNNLIRIPKALNEESTLENLSIKWNLFNKLEKDS